MINLKKLLSVLLAAILCASFGGCGKGKGPGKKPGKDAAQYEPADFRYQPSVSDPELDTDDLSVWSAYTTDKITRDGVRGTKYREIYVEAAGDETESAQLIMTAYRDVAAYTLEVSELKNGNEVFPADAIEVFVQHYIEVTSPTAPNMYEAGWYPDALIPYDRIIAKGENKVEAGDTGRNQGFWFNINVPSGQPAGLYEGEVTLKADDDTFKVPMKIKIFDFSIGKAMHAQSTFGIWSNMFASVYGKGCDTDALYSAYYEFLLKYKINVGYLPGTLKTSTRSYGCSPETYAQQAYKYGKRDEVNAFFFPGEVGDVDFTYLMGYFIKTAESVIKDGKVEFNIFEKTFQYTIDEPAAAKFRSTTEATNKIRDVRRAAAEQLLTEYKDVEGIEELADSLVHMDLIVTQKLQRGLMTKYDGKYVGGVETWCPLYNAYAVDNGPYFYDSYKAAERGEKLWWYGCCDPKSPYANYHLDNSAVSPRIVGWQMKDYDIDGNLYWSTSVFQKYDGRIYHDRDVWTDPLSFPGTNGDGFLLYPGNKYDLGNDPIPTIRLCAIRDGQEDYEYLYILDRLIQETNALYGTPVTMEEVMTDLYDSLYTGVIPKDEYEPVFLARSEVAGMIEALKAELKVMATVCYDESDNGELVSVYAPEGAEVKINGVKARYEDKAYKAVLYFDYSDDNVIEIKVKKDGKEAVLYRTAPGGGKVLDVMDVSGIVSDSIKAEVVRGHIGKGINLRCNETGKENTAVYDMKNIDLGDYKALEFYVRNNGKSVERIELTLFDAKNNKVTGAVVVRPGRWTKASVRLVKGGVFDVSDVKSLEFGVKMIGADPVRCIEADPPLNVIIDGLTAV